MNLVVFLFSFFLWALGAKTAEVVLTPRPSATLVGMQSIEQANHFQTINDTTFCFYEFESNTGFRNEHIDHPVLFIQTSKKEE